jgi:tRNA A-37 threonylcarbamoyl transferase component Bud32
MLTGVRKLVMARGIALTLRGRAARPCAVPDILNPWMIPSVTVRGLGDRVLAEVDQDGFLFATDVIDLPFFDRRTAKMPRHRSRIDVVLRGSAVLLRKQHLAPARYPVRERVRRRVGLDFYTEVVALARLQGLPCVPQLREFQPRSHTLFTDFIWGENLRHRLAATANPVFNVDINADPVLRRLTDDERVHREFMLWSVLPEAAAWRAALGETMAAIHQRGVAHRDIHLANVMVGALTGLPYWVDFEGADLRVGAGWQQLVAEDCMRFRNTFGLQ